MSLTQAQVRHVAKLARLKLTDSEVDLFAEQLSKVFGYMEILNEVDTSKVPPTFQVTGLQNVMREDIIQKYFAGLEELLACSGMSKEKEQILVPKVL